MFLITGDIRVDPAGDEGIHLVQEGGERVYVSKNKIDKLIDDLKKVVK